MCADLILRVFYFYFFMTSTNSLAVRIANSMFDKVGMVLKLGKNFVVCAVVNPFVVGIKNRNIGSIVARVQQTTHLLRVEPMIVWCCCLHIRDLLCRVVPRGFC